MIQPGFLLNSTLTVTLLLWIHSVAGQAPNNHASPRPSSQDLIPIKGTIYDKTKQFGLQGVSVIGTSGAGTTTDSMGHYYIRLSINDSIYFSYLGKSTVKYPVKNLSPIYQYTLDLSFQVSVGALPVVIVRKRSYQEDSAANRNEYRKAFDFGTDVVSDANGSIGFNLDVLFNAKKIRQMEHLQKRLLWQESEKYIDHRFNKTLVHRITGLERPAIDSFMRQYRPSKEFILSCENEYEFEYYIKQWSRSFVDNWIRTHPK